MATESPGGLIRATEHANRLAWWHSAALVVPHIVGALVLHHATPVPWSAVFAPLVIATIIHGHHHDPKPPAPIAVPPERGDITRDLLNDALRAVGVLPKPTSQAPEPPGIEFAAIPRPVGIGRRLVINLPASVKAAWADVVKERSRIAASLALPEAQFYLEQGQHAGQVVIWHADRDPFAGPLLEHPLFSAKAWDVWEPAPFGHEPWGTPADQCLVFSSILVAARPRRGKTYATRSAVLPGVLDPHVRFHVWNLKGDEAWDHIEPVCDISGGVYGKGRTDAQLETLAATLEALCNEMDERNARIHGSKLTPEQARNPQANVPVTFIIIDEVQRAFTSNQGDRIAASLIDLAKNGPSSGFVLVLATQRSGADVLPTDLRASLGARFALHVLTWRDSDIILGDGMATDGYDASDLPMHKGVGILRPDDDADDDTTGGDDPRPAKTIRVYDTGDEMWSWVCDHGLELRRQLAGSIGDDEDDPAPRGLLTHTVAALRDHGDLSASGLLKHLPEPWNELRADQLGAELREVGLRSRATNSGRRYRAEDAVVALSCTRRDPVVPRRATTGHDTPTTVPLRGSQQGATTGITSENTDRD